MRCCPPMRRLRPWCGSLINPQEGEEMKSSDIACTAKCAHLAGIYPKRAQAEKEADAKKIKRAEDEEDEKSAEDEEEEKEAEDEDAAEEAPKKEKKSQKAKRAKVEDEEEDAEDAPDEKKDSRKAKRAKADEGKKEDAEARGRRLERARAQAIFASPAAGIRPEIAAQLAFQTSLPSDEAIALLASIAAGAPRRSADLAERMATIPSPNVGVEGAEPNGARTLAAHILAAGRKARGERLPTEQEQR